MSELTIPEAVRSLHACSDLMRNSPITPDQAAIARAALLYLQQASDYQIFGICADRLSEAHQALRDYTQAFGYDIPPDTALEAERDGGIYVKFNPRTQRCLIDSYTGQYRGVLVSYHTDFADGHSGTYGHFPLDLFVNC